MPDSLPAEPTPVHDPLTRLPNDRAFHERLGGEVARAGRHGRPLSVAILGLDRCAQINANHGRAVGDSVLVELARRLASRARQGELVARVGGDRFAWILPDTDGVAAFAGADRIRRAIAKRPVAPVGIVTVSIGICDVENAPSISELCGRAEQALRWAKQHGRDQCFRYSTVTAGELAASGPPDGAAERADLSAHWTRVASLLTTLAVRAGWAPSQVVALRRAALLIDGAHREAAGFSPEQVAWVRHRHERWDGSGHPDGLRGSAIPEGAQLIALADAYDELTHDRPSRPRVTPPQAVAALRADAGRQFSERMLALLASSVT